MGNWVGKKGVNYISPVKLSSIILFKTKNPSEEGQMEESSVSH